MRSQTRSQTRSHTTLAAVVLPLGLSVLSSTTAHAAAYYAGEMSTRAMARGGANLVDPRDPTSAWLNPAAMTLSTGLQLNLDLNFIYLSSTFVRNCGGVVDGCGPKDLSKTYTGQDGKKQRYTITGDRPPSNDDAQPGPPDVNGLGNLGTPSKVDGVTPVVNAPNWVLQPVPRVFLTFNTDSFGLDGGAIGLYFAAPNQGDYGFAGDGVTRYTLIDRDLFEVYYGIAAAYRFGDWISVGAGLQGVSSGLDQTLALSADQYGNEDPDFDIKVHITAAQHLIPSGNFGLWSNPGRLLGIGDLELALSAQLGRTVRATGPVKLEGFGSRFQSEFLDPGLVELNVADDATATAEFSLAPIYRGGIKYGLDNLGGDLGISFDVETDVVYEQWSVYDHVFLKTKGVTADLNTNDDVPGAELDPGVQPKDWDDSLSLRLGGSFGLWHKMLEAHVGGYYETSAIPSSTYSVELVDGDKIGLGTGLSGRMFGVRLDLGYSFIYVLDRTVGDESIVYNGNSGPSILMNGESRTRVAMGKYSAAFHMLSVGVNVAFDDMLGFGVHAKKTSSEPIVPAAAPAAPAKTDDVKDAAPTGTPDAKPELPPAAPGPDPTPSPAPPTSTT